MVVRNDIVSSDLRLLSGSLPDWVPSAARNYLFHTARGASLRELARSEGVHASTLSRQVRKLETQRDDPLIDQALCQLEQLLLAEDHSDKVVQMSFMETIPNPTPNKDQLDAEAARILCKMAEPGAVLALATGLDRAVVARDASDGSTVKMAVVEQSIATAMALKEWISCEDPATRIKRYRITPKGRAKLRMLEAALGPDGFSENATVFSFDGAMPQRGGWGEDNEPKLRHGSVESPLIALSRRRTKEGSKFLSDELVSVGERLREDFEITQLGKGAGFDWARCLSADVTTADLPNDSPAVSAAAIRVADALRDLGPGLGDVVLRCCCFLEGMEVAEKHLGWSARSGKIVLRIALQRLRRHYDKFGKFGPMIG